MRRLAKEKEEREREQRERDRNREEEKQDDDDKENEEPAEEFSPHSVQQNHTYEGVCIFCFMRSETGNACNTYSNN